VEEASGFVIKVKQRSILRVCYQILANLYTFIDRQKLLLSNNFPTINIFVRRIISYERS
jgi:hypothetical protein